MPDRNLRLARSLLLRVRGGTDLPAVACSEGDPGMPCFKWEPNKLLRSLQASNSNP